MVSRNDLAGIQPTNIYLFHGFPISKRWLLAPFQGIDGLIFPCALYALCGYVFYLHKKFIAKSAPMIKLGTPATPSPL